MKTIAEFDSRDSANRYKFDPSDFYIHEVLRFKTKHTGTRDKVSSFNEAENFWT